MARLIAFANRKGGSGKTATTVNVAACLAELGYSTLVVDLDAQAHASISLGISPYQLDQSVYELLTDETIKIDDVIQRTAFKNLDILPASQKMERANEDLNGVKTVETILAQKFEPVIHHYTYILFDCPAAPGLVLNNALTAAKELMIPMQTQFLAMEGLAQMTRMVYAVNATLNPALKITGVIPTLCNLRTRLAQTVLKEVRKNFTAELLYPPIRMNIQLAEAPSHGQPIIYYAPNSNGAADYRKLTTHLLNPKLQTLQISEELQ